MAEIAKKTTRHPSDLTDEEREQTAPDPRSLFPTCYVLFSNIGEENSAGHA